MLKATDNKDLILYTAIPILSVFVLVCAIYIIYKFCCSKPSQDDRESLITNNERSYDRMSMSDLRITNDVFLIQKVNEQKRKIVFQSRESAYVYLNFYIRSNPELEFKSIEHLNNIGSQAETERNWFLVKQTVQIDNSSVNKYKIIILNIFSSKSNPKKIKLSDIADSMNLTYREMQFLLNDFFKNIKHPNVLGFDTVDVNFEKERVLFLQDYSRDGSLRDHLRGTNPYDIWEIKYERETKVSLPIKTIKEYGKQILAGLIYLKQNYQLPFEDLHSGNIILAYKKKLCLLTGYENSLFFYKTRIESKNEKLVQRISKTYLIREKNPDTDEFVLRKAKNDFEIKRMIEILRFGVLIIEMCTGFEQEELIPRENVLNTIKTFYIQSESNELMSILMFIFFNRAFIDEDNQKQKKKFYLPDLEQVYSHKFFESVKYKNIQTSDSVAKNPQHLELLKYLTGRLDTRPKRLRRKSSLSQNISSKKRLSVIKEPELEISTESNSKVSFTPQNTTNIPPPPPPPLSAPPAPPLLGSLVLSTPILPPFPAIPPAPAMSTLPSIEESDDRSALLGDIRKGLKLKKTVTIDKSKPKFG